MQCIAHEISSAWRHCASPLWCSGCHRSHALRDRKAHFTHLHTSSHIFAHLRTSSHIFTHLHTSSRLMAYGSAHISADQRTSAHKSARLSDGGRLLAARPDQARSGCKCGQIGQWRAHVSTPGVGWCEVFVPSPDRVRPGLANRHLSTEAQTRARARNAAPRHSLCRGTRQSVAQGGESAGPVTCRIRHLSWPWAQAQEKEVGEGEEEDEEEDEEEEDDDLDVWALGKVLPYARLRRSSS